MLSGSVVRSHHRKCTGSEEARRPKSEVEHVGCGSYQGTRAGERRFKAVERPGGRKQGGGIEGGSDEMAGR